MPDGSRETPGLAARAVQEWFGEHVPAAAGPLRFDVVVGGGHSNIIYRVTDSGGQSFALRRPPLGAYPPGAHDVIREARVLSALGPSAVPVPRVLAVCDDVEITGAPFVVMTWVDGHVVATPGDVERILPDPSTRQRAAWELVDTLADLHGVDVTAVGLGDLSPRGDFIARALHRWLRVWDRVRTRDLPVVTELADRLGRSRPQRSRTGLVHTDFRFGNVMLGSDGRVVAILDWELASVGDVLADIGVLLNSWELPADATPPVWMQTPPTRAAGFPDRTAIIDRYAERTGFDLADLADVAYYRAFAYWRMAVIAEGVKRRYESASLAGSPVDFAHLDRRVIDLTELADLQLRASTA
ncbi:phosphotransferase family protein [Frankia sp. Cas3]|uniref:phosphotransferase family protein n=1 Tax=Frankia sp. Cas3 TaxID=3073926 RepID=UPI002AD33D57|nr:phosphotransferase family protein [Frankia sp. Cas3]